MTHAFCWPEVRRGGERYLHELSAALARRGHDVTVIAGASRWSSGVGRDGVRTLRVRRAARSVHQGEHRFAQVLFPYLMLKRFDVVHSLGPLDAVAALRTRRQRRTVYTCLGLPRKNSWDRLPAGPAHARVVEETDVYGCLSKYAQELLLHDFGRRGAITPGGVSLVRFKPGKRNREPTLLFASSMDEPRKGLATLLEALPLIVRCEPRVVLWLCAPGDPKPVLDRAPAAVREHVRVLPLGDPDDLADRYASAWATVLPSLDEAFGLVLVESLAVGTPIVATDHASLSELVEPGTGELTRPNDPVALASACCRVLALSGETGVIERCRAAAERHDWDAHVAPAIEALYLGASRDATG